MPCTRLIGTAAPTALRVVRAPVTATIRRLVSGTGGRGLLMPAAGSKAAAAPMSRAGCRALLVTTTTTSAVAAGVVWHAMPRHSRTMCAGASAEFTTTASGLRYYDEVAGDGESPTVGDTVLVHYTGTLPNGQQFDSSRGRGPLEFKVGIGQVISGWDEGILSMKVGGKRKLIIPPQLGYGARGAGSVIPPNAVLLFDCELVAVNPPPSSVLGKMRAMVGL